MPERFLRLPEVMEKTGLTRSAVYTGMNENTFPKPIKLPGHRIALYIESEVDAWIHQRITATRGADYIPPSIPQASGGGDDVELSNIREMLEHIKSKRPVVAKPAKFYEKSQVIPPRGVVEYMKLMMAMENLDAQSYAAKLGFPHQTIYAVLSGVRPPSKSLIKKLGLEMVYRFSQPKQ